MIFYAISNETQIVKMHAIFLSQR